MKSLDECLKFEDELNLTYAVIDGIEARGQHGNCSTQRFKLDPIRFLTFLYLP
jgi:hypothetical protein